MKTHATNNDEITSWLILHLAPGLGPIHLQQLLQLFTSPMAICQLTRPEMVELRLPKHTIAAIQQPNWHRIKKILQWTTAEQHHLLTLHDPLYPPQLREISNPPYLLYVDGHVELLSHPQLAIVGSRRPTHNGLSLARHFAIQLSQAGITITSGMAQGIDQASHQGALTQSAATIAVFGSGIDVIYPPQAYQLAQRIAHHGALVSEFSLMTQPHKKHFPQRNRIISGLTLGTLVIEAALKSGSLITAQYAVEQGREVFAIPSAITNPMAAGCHYLIQQGAKLTTQLSDILTELNIYPQANVPLNRCGEIKSGSQTPALITTNPTKLDKDHQKLLECIGFGITYFEQLVDNNQFSIQKVSAMLCNLKLNGYIKEELGGYSRVII